MTLSDYDMIKAIENGDIFISELKEGQIQPASIDLTLGDDFKIIKKDQIITNDKPVEYLSFKQKEVVLEPGDFLLANTRELISLGDRIAGQISGKSSWGRRGLKIENAGFVDPGFNGEITLEILNEGNAPIKIKFGDEICQIEFRELKTPCNNSYDGRYNGQIGATGAKKRVDKIE